MEQELLVFVLVLLIGYLIYSIRNAGLVRAEFDGQIYMVQELPDKSKAVDFLIKLKVDLASIAQKSLDRAKTENNKDYINYIQIIVDKLNSVFIREVEKDRPYTSYSVNKGEELVFCLRNKEYIKAEKYYIECMGTCECNCSSVLSVNFALAQLYYNHLNDINNALKYYEISLNNFIDNPKEMVYLFGKKTKKDTASIVNAGSSN